MSIAIVIFYAFVLCIIIALAGEFVRGHASRRASKEMRQVVKGNPWLKGEIVIFDGMSYEELTHVELDGISNKMRIRLAHILSEIKGCEEADLPWVVHNGHVKTWTY